MKRIIEYTTYEGSSVRHTFIGSNVELIDAQEYDLDEWYRKCYGIGSHTKKVLFDNTETLW